MTGSTIKDPTSRVVTRLWGGLGNQLFALAAGLRLSRANGAQLVLDTETGFRRDPYGRSYELDELRLPFPRAGRRERLEPLERIRRQLLRRRGLRHPFETRYVVQPENRFDDRILKLKVRGTVFLEGYWQSERFFVDVADEIKSFFDAPTDSGPHAARSAAVHVRWFQRPGSPAHSIENLDAGYYRRAINRLRSEAEIDEIVVYSERPREALELARQASELPVRLGSTDRRRSPLTELQLMAQHTHFIIANSTFSWWAAWLGRADEKAVVAPAVAFRGPTTSWGHDGLLPERWLRA